MHDILCKSIAVLEKANPKKDFALVDRQKVSQPGQDWKPVKLNDDLNKVDRTTGDGSCSVEDGHHTNANVLCWRDKPLPPKVRHYADLVKENAQREAKEKEVKAATTETSETLVED